MKTVGIIFMLSATFLHVMSTPDTNSNEILVSNPINETGISVQDGTLYQDLIGLVQLYAPSVLELIEVSQKENLWELMKIQLWRWISSILGDEYDEEAERSGQKILDETVFTIPYLDYPITKSQIEGIVFDSLAVYRKWQKSE